MHPAWALGALVVALLLTACDASVERFTASPHYVCRGQKVQIAWRVKGSGTMKSVPPLASLPDGPVDDEAQATVTPNSTTNVELHVTRFLGHPTSSTQELRVLDAMSMPEPLAVSLADPSAGCDGAKVWATVRPSHFANDLRVGTVSSHAGDDRTYDVVHGGVRGTVTPGAIATQFDGQPIAGGWVLTSKLRPGEVCGTPSLPRALVIDVNTKCVPGES